MVAACLQLTPQHCQLLLHTLAAVSPSPAMHAAGGAVSMHQLLLFLLAQMYGRDAHKPETQDHWPDAETRLARAVSPGAGLCLQLQLADDVARLLNRWLKLQS